LIFVIEILLVIGYWDFDIIMRIYIKVIPKSSQNKVEKISDGEYKAWVTSAPVGGAANKKVIELVADFFDVSKSQVEIVAGKTTRKKIVDIFL